jgi:thiamine pyrophosphate-dependent acetolactate synthase large subunit-like protein
VGHRVIAQALDRREVVKAVLHKRTGILVVSGLGSPTYDVMAAGDNDNNYYLWGAMGSAAMVGLGLALSQPERKIVVFTGDGEMLMGLGSLATVAVMKPANLSIIVLDNGHYGETGMQLSHAGHGINLDKVADACGFGWTARIDDMDGVQELRKRIHEQDDLNFARIIISHDNPVRVMPSRDGVFIKNRFRAALGFTPD